MKIDPEEVRPAVTTVTAHFRADLEEDLIGLGTLSAEALVEILNRAGSILTKVLSDWLVPVALPDKGSSATQINRAPT